MESSNKKTLLIMPKFYGYEDIVASAMKEKFQSIKLIYENRDWVSFWHRFVYVYMPNKKRKVLDDFYIKELSNVDKDIDVVLVIRGSSLSGKIMEYMKSIFPEKCQYIMYQWDGIKNNQDALSVVKYFDHIYTFDVKDAVEYGWGYRPLFFDRRMIKSLNKDIDISFLCSLHSQRAQILNKLKPVCTLKGYNFHTHMYCGKFLYYKWKYIGKKSEYKDTNNKDVSFKSLTLQESYDLYSRSKVIVDYTHPGQTGFTMRTIEAIGNRCKLITNNAYIKNADFYNPNNIYVYEGTDVNIPEGFVDSNYEDIDEKLYSYYSLEGWLNTLLGSVENVKYK